MDRSRYDATGFRGRVERTRADSEPWWPAPTGAGMSAPNIVIVYMDDMGYSDPGCFGSEIETPSIDALAARGLRFNHYTTHPICSPARAALLTGRNAHSVGTGWLANNNAGFPGYTGEIPLDAATLAETLRAGGYATMMVGKWHNTPGPLSLPSSVQDSWPTQRGFEHFDVPALTQVNGRSARELHGRSFAAVVSSAGAASPRHEQYYECWSNRGYYRDGWLARSLQKRGQPIDLDNWTLHDLNRDFSESVDVGERHPDTLRELVAAFDDAAWTNLVYPLDNRTMVQKMSDGAARAVGAAPAARAFASGTQTVHRAVVVPLISDRSYTVRAAFVWRDIDQGVVWAIGEQIGGVVLYVEDGRLRLCYNGYGEFSELPPVALAAGEVEATLEYEALGNRQGRGRILLNGVEKTPWQALSPTLMVGFHEGLDIGLDRRAPVSWDVYQKHGTFRYTGTIRGVTIEPGARAPDSPLAGG
ncbi:MAG: hypothetical protein DME04_21540 [Candidatus Rokuibacteriota bacterium]|nr:MAG: hypothetical protein DME04_21540 [Candidatus Rokubacteria bacterium]